MEPVIASGAQPVSGANALAAAKRSFELVGVLRDCFVAVPAPAQAEVPRNDVRDLGDCFVAVPAPAQAGAPRNDGFTKPCLKSGMPKSAH